MTAAPEYTQARPVRVRAYQEKGNQLQTSHQPLDSWHGSSYLYCASTAPDCTVLVQIIVTLMYNSYLYYTGTAHKHTFRAAGSEDAKAWQHKDEVEVGDCPAEHVAVKAVQEPPMPGDQVARVLCVCVCGGG